MFKDINFDIGNFSIEIFIYKNRIFLAEIEPSIPGSRIIELISKTYKFDILKHSVELLTKDKIYDNEIKLINSGKIIFHRLKKAK